MRSFQYLWSGQLLANLGDVLYIVGLITYIYSVSQSAFMLALLPFINTFGRFFSGITSTIFMNRYPLKELLVFSQLYKTCLLLVLAVWNQSGTIPLVILLVFIFLIAVLDGLALPATDSMLPRLVKKAEIVKANSFISIVTESTQLGGWAIGGMLAIVLGSHQLIWITFGLYVISTYLLWNIKDTTSFQPEYHQKSIRTEMHEGFSIIWGNKLFRVISVEMLFEAVANVVWVAAIVYVYVEEVLNRSEAWWGYTNTSFFCGMIVGGIICTRYHATMEVHLKQIMILCSLLVGIVTSIFGFVSIGWVALGAAFIHGVLRQMKSVSLNTYLQKEATDQELPKIYGLQAGGLSLIFGISTLIFGALTDLIGVRYVFLISGGILTLITLYLLRNQSVFPPYSRETPLESKC